jgi:hypothetical protein
MQKTPVVTDVLNFFAKLPKRVLLESGRALENV